MRNDVRCGFHTIKARDLDRLGALGVISQIKERVGDSKVYISVDIDVLDPAFAPGKSRHSLVVLLVQGDTDTARLSDRDCRTWRMVITGTPDSS